MFSDSSGNGSCLSNISELTMGHTNQHIHETTSSVPPGKLALFKHAGQNSFLVRVDIETCQQLLHLRQFLVEQFCHGQ